MPQVKFQMRYGRVAAAPASPMTGRRSRGCQGLQGAGWQLLGASVLAAPEAQLRRHQGRGSSTSRTGAAARQLVDLPELGRRRRPPHLRPPHLRRRGVYGFKSTGRGRPLDSYGRNIYLDTFDSAFGKGWHRENSFLTHHRGHTLGDFCYGFFPHAGHPSGQGTKYRATVEGPGRNAGRDVGGRRHRLLRRASRSDAGAGAELGRPEVPHLTLAGRIRPGRGAERRARARLRHRRRARPRSPPPRRAPRPRPAAREGQPLLETAADGLEQLGVGADAAAEHDEREIERRRERQDVEGDPAGRLLDDARPPTPSPARAAAKISCTSNGGSRTVSFPAASSAASLRDRRGARIDVVGAALADRVELSRGAVPAAVKLPAEHDGGAEPGPDEQEGEVGDALGDSAAAARRRRRG